MAAQPKPAYQQIADDIRQRILDGDLQAGDKLPTETDLMADYGVSRIVARNATQVLQGEGLVEKRQGAGTFVRGQRPRRKRISGDLYGKRPTASPMRRQTEAEGRRSEWEWQTRITAATKAVAERLAVEAGDEVVRTTYRFFADDEPVMLSTSYEPRALIAGTPVEQPEGGPVTGVVPRLDSIGQHITHVTEDVNARAPRPYEAEQLQIAPGVPVMAITRTYYVGERPVESADIVVAADRYTLSYVIPIPPLSDEA
ncbi:GntR family transcriptional regulator [Streptomyces sp. NBC_00140]|uniref:GntR family transcriptional regulator n=1 Tax=Streptomyces sp. NBC_00140 TaxID=2975664 RepID=UPI00225BB692|nr:GntR family transcriptional regulator [Streptomyces sp. NBC_00140]MCX5338122.1 GntR family transcriptional regulator [Streptomyces sp. NBC_00140]